MYIYIVYVPQYPTQGGIETMGKYLETRSDKSILSNNLCNLESIILTHILPISHFCNPWKRQKPFSNVFRGYRNVTLGKYGLNNNCFENGELKYHQKWGFATGTKFAPLYSNLVMTELEKRSFQSSDFKLFLYDTFMKFLAYGPKVLKN